MRGEVYVGLMSGTSLDGISAAAATFTEDGARVHPTLLSHAHRPFTPEERERLLAAMSGGTAQDYCRLAVDLGHWLADAAELAITASGASRRDVAAVVSHGQTLWHEPGHSTWQLGQPAVIAERLDVDVISDLRARDVAAGGQGAPLVSIADVLCFAHDDAWRVLQNLGGIGNLTAVPPLGSNAPPIAFDTGPGVVLMDGVVRMLLPSLLYDVDGVLARQGRPVDAVVDSALTQPYFSAAPPKTTGRELFSSGYIAQFIDACRVAQSDVSVADIIATAVAFTAESIADQMSRFVHSPVADVLLAGGGADNPTLVHAIDLALASRFTERAPKVRRFSDVYFDGGAKESVAFALMGWLHHRGRAGNMPAATGARAPRARHTDASAYVIGRQRARAIMTVTPSTTPAVKPTVKPAAKPAARELAQLVIPAITWRSPGGFDHEKERIEEYLALGVGGFLLIGGEQDVVRTLAKRLQRESRNPLLIAADLERGAGQQFGSATGLPPLAAIAALDDMEALKRAARLTAREARTMGENWNLAPECDVDTEADNQVLGTRAFGSEFLNVGKLATAWIEACQSEGVLSCAKHFQGHGRTREDSHLTLPVVDAPLDVLKEQDIAPFRAAIAAGVASIMTAHVAYPALDPSGLPATLSREMLQWLLRQQLKFENLIVADALIMRGVLEGRDETEAAVLAIQAGCDVLLQPDDVVAVVDALEQARSEGRIDPERARLALRRRLKWAQWASPPNDWRRPSGADTAWGAMLAERCVRVEHGPLPGAGEHHRSGDRGRRRARAGHARVAQRISRRTARGRGGRARRAGWSVAGEGDRCSLPVLGDRLPSKGRAGLLDRYVTRVQQVVLAQGESTVILCTFGDPQLVQGMGSRPSDAAPRGAGGHRDGMRRQNAGKGRRVGRVHRSAVADEGASHCG